nr:hypothetical protein [Haloarcula mannanilytica]
MRPTRDIVDLPTDASFTTVDTHTEGEPTRILLDWLDDVSLAGDSIRGNGSLSPTSTTGSANC